MSRIPSASTDVPEERHRAGRAPGDLALLQSFVNTWDAEGGRDLLDSPAAVGAWLSTHGLTGESEGSTPAGQRRTREVREALRLLLAANNPALFVEGQVLARAAANLSAAARRGRPALRVGADGRFELGAEEGRVDGALTRLLAIALQAQAEGRWSRLKVCRADACRWAFYDRSRGRTATWCAMATCGSRAKMRSYHRRRSVRAGGPLSAALGDTGPAGRPPSPLVPSP
ncbi:MAG: CGNR zinc finger domain-containing protein [Candidatus Dormiibacterota bacterium]